MCCLQWSEIIIWLFVSMSMHRSDKLVLTYVCLAYFLFSVRIITMVATIIMKKVIIERNPKTYCKPQRRRKSNRNIHTLNYQVITKHCFALFYTNECNFMGKLCEGIKQLFFAVKSLGQLTLKTPYTLLPYVSSNKFFLFVLLNSMVAAKKIRAFFHRRFG